MKTRCLSIFATALASLAAASTATAADEFSPTGALTSDASATPLVLAARGAELLWGRSVVTSALPAGSGYELNAGFGSHARDLGVAAPDPFIHSDLATDSHGEPVAIYPRCPRAGRCLRFRHSITTGTDAQLSAGDCSEIEPIMENGTSIWRTIRSIRAGARCPVGPYLQYPGRRAQLMHPPGGCTITDLTGGVVACARDVQLPTQEGSTTHDRTEVYALRLGHTHWRLIARADSFRTETD